MPFRCTKTYRLGNRETTEIGLVRRAGSSGISVMQVQGLSDFSTRRQDMLCSKIQCDERDVWMGSIV